MIAADRRRMTPLLGAACALLALALLRPMRESPTALVRSVASGAYLLNAWSPTMDVNSSGLPSARPRL